MLESVAASVAAMAVCPSVSPGVFREVYEWCNVWIPRGDEQVDRRVLIAGDSISMGYYPGVVERLGEAASVARLSTSKCAGDPALIDEVVCVLKQYPFNLVHFNIGLHGVEYTESAYEQGIRDLLATFRGLAPDAGLVWASTTPMRVGNELEKIHPFTERVIERNRIVEGMMRDEGIPTHDLFAPMIGHPEYYAADGTHFNDSGIEIQAAQVASAISAALDLDRS